MIQMTHGKCFSIRMLALGMVLLLCVYSCNRFSSKQEFTNSENSVTAPVVFEDSTIVYNSETIKIQKISNHIYQHTSFLTTNDFGVVPCNGMLVVNQNEAIVFDTPTNPKSSSELINFVKNNLHCSIVAVIPTHFHEDCVGGLETFDEQNIPIYASYKTIKLLNLKGQLDSKQINGFAVRNTFYVGDKQVMAEYFGEGHTVDNIIGYVPSENAIFGGCLIKEIDASRGYLGDANTNQWAETVKKIKQKFPQAKIIIPGHGAWGGLELLDYTIQLFE